MELLNLLLVTYFLLYNYESMPSLPLLIVDDIDNREV